MVAASIVVHKTPSEQLSKAIDCLKNSPVEIIYVIDNSPDDSLRKVVRDKDKVRYFHVENNGFGAGHNIAIRKSMEEGADYHLVMNADVWWEGDIITPMIKYLESDIKTGLIAPKTYYPNGDLQYTCRMLPTPVDLFFKRFLPGNLKKKRMRRYLLQDHDHEKPLDCPYLLGSFMFFRMEALKETGLFDERFFMYPEDIDITRRVHEKWKTLYWPGVSIIHEHQQASSKNVRMFLIHFTNMVKYFNKWGWICDRKREQFNSRLSSQVR